MTKIIVADDEENITDAIAYALERENYQVYKTFDGKEALDLIRKEQPDILILDIMMPDYNGYDLCKNIDDSSNMGIIMLTAKSTLVDKILGL
ncbi:MAG: response regulator transcription factor [Clostridiales bacterium]|uniref:response regulator n=1 Tax=Aminipila sp. TaxID=2060095 RepID=UPI001DCC65CE|nr:response regulator [Aminipila sp.]MBE6035280.1 response regulator transcription factor [Clostridiales bacterium]